MRTLIQVHRPQSLQYSRYPTERRRIGCANGLTVPQKRVDSARERCPSCSRQCSPAGRGARRTSFNSQSEVRLAGHGWDIRRASKPHLNRQCPQCCTAASMGKSRAPYPYVNCPYDCKVGAVSTKFRRCEGLTGGLLRIRTRRTARRR